MLAHMTMLVLGLLAVLTLVVDVGFATLTRVQMQNAADAAATEGLRQRDAVAGDGYASDCLRRLAARDVVRWTFDDDFDDTTLETARQFGAGPLFDQGAEGIGDLDAGRTIALPAGGVPPVYKPRPQINRDNAAHGDIVSGTFTAYDPLPLPDETFDYTQPGHDAVDETQRTRANFVVGTDVPPPGLSPFDPCPELPPDAAAWTPASGAPALGDTALLVRLRRTANVDGLDDLPDPFEASGSNGISSNGGALPLLFGRGALLAADPGGDYSVRRDGLTLRAGAVAAADPALAAGLARPGLEGLAPFVLDEPFVRTLAAADMPVALTLDAAGHAESGGLPAAAADLDLAALALFLATQRTAPDEQSLLFAGDDLAACAGCVVATLDDAAGVGWAPVRAVVGLPAAARIIGFVRVRFTIAPSGGLSGTLTLDRAAMTDPFLLRPAIAATNASARLLRDGAGFDPGTLQAVRAAAGCLAGQPDPARCPVPVDVLLRTPRLAR